MAKITRKNIKIFAGNSSNTGVFGSAQAGSGNLSTDIEEMQSLSAWSNGWLSAVLGGNKLPAIEEMEAINRVLSYAIANIYQDGIPIYDDSTTYYINSIVRKDTTTEIYKSLTDDNVGNLLTDTGNWKLLIDLGNFNQFNDMPFIGSYIDLTLGASGSTYVFPANGFILLNKSGNSGEYIAFSNNGSYIASFSAASNAGIGIMMPARKGDTITYSYTATGATSRFRFIYTEGSKP